MAFPRSTQHDQQHDSADGDVSAVEAGQHKERRAEDAGVKRQAVVSIGLVVLVCLTKEKRYAQNDGGNQPINDF